MGRLFTGQGAGGGPGIDQRAAEGARNVGKTLQDVIRDQDNAKREKKGEAAEGSAATAEKSAADDAARADLVSKKQAPTTGMPKQDPGESAAAYSGRIRRWRETQQAAQSRALNK